MSDEQADARPTGGDGDPPAARRAQLGECPGQCPERVDAEHPPRGRSGDPHVTVRQQRGFADERLHAGERCVADEPRRGADWREPPTAQQHDESGSQRQPDERREERIEQERDGREQVEAKHHERQRHQPDERTGERHLPCGAGEAVQPADGPGAAFGEEAVERIALELCGGAFGCPDQDGDGHEAQLRRGAEQVGGIQNEHYQRCGGERVVT